MELKVTFVCDSKKKIVTMPHSISLAKIAFPKYEKSYDIKPSAIGYVHKISYDIPENLDILSSSGREQGGINTYEGMVRHALASHIKGKNARNIAFG